MKNNSTAYKETIEACIENGRRLLDDATDLQEYERFPTAKALAILAQEEFAKAYIIKLVLEGAVPWCNEIYRATRDHHCKQLMGIVMEYLFTPLGTESLMERERKINENISDFVLPKKVADALNIFCHEKINKWKSSSWVWVEEPKYDIEAKKVWNGKIEKTKQDSLYVAIGKDGRVANIPRSYSDDVKKQIEYTKVLEEVASGLDVYARSEEHTSELQSH